MGGYKIFQRCKDCRLEGLTDRSRRPYRQANQLPFQIEKLIVQLKQEHSSWGAPKIREKLRRLHSEVQPPAISDAQKLLGHTSAQTTKTYLRGKRVISVEPMQRRIR